MHMHADNDNNDCAPDLELAHRRKRRGRRNQRVECLRPFRKIFSNHRDRVKKNGCQVPVPSRNHASAQSQPAMHSNSIASSLQSSKNNIDHVLEKDQNGNAVEVTVINVNLSEMYVFNHALSLY